MTRTYLTKDAQIHQLQRQVEDLKKDKAELVEKCKVLLAESLRYKQHYDSSLTQQNVFWYMVCWRSNTGESGVIEVSLHAPWGVGDVVDVIRYIENRNPSTGKVVPVSVHQITAPEKEDTWR